MVDFNSVLCFFEGYETILAFDNQKSVFLFKIDLSAAEIITVKTINMHKSNVNGSTHV